MYNWRKLTPAQQAEVLRLRKQHGLPWHSPPHRVRVSDLYHIAAANHEHQVIMGATAERMATFERDLLQTLEALGAKSLAWCVLPNHYHMLIQTESLPRVLR